MKKISSGFLYLIVLSVILACGSDEKRVRFEGELKNIHSAEFFVYSECGAFEGVDTIKIQDGEFVYERELEEPVLLTLLYPNYSRSYVVAEPGKVVKMKGDASRLGEAEVSGTEENELLTEFRQSVKNASARESRIAAVNFVRSNAKTLAAVAVFHRYFTSWQTPEAQEALRLLDELREAQGGRAEVRYLDRFFRPLLLNGTGASLPDFKATTVKGETVSLKDYKGKPLIIAALATWHPESDTFIRNLHKVLRRRSPRPELLIVNMDADAKPLEDLLKRDSVSCTVICEKRTFESPIVQTLGIRYLPSCMTVNSKGVILQRDVEAPEKINWNELR